MGSVHEGLLVKLGGVVDVVLTIVVVVIEGGWIGDVVVVETVIGVDTEGLNVVVETTDVAHVGIVLLTLTFEGTVITVIVSGILMSIR